MVDSRALWYLSESRALPLSHLVLGFSPPRASGGRGRRKEKQLLAFRVTHRALAIAEMNSLSKSLSLVVSGEWRTKIGWREHTVPEINWKSRDSSGKEESHSTALSPFSEFKSREYLVFMCVDPFCMKAIGLRALGP